MEQGEGEGMTAREGTKRVTVAEAARELGVGQQCVREHMKRGLWPIGYADSPKITGGKDWEYYIFRDKLDKFLGKDAANEAGKGVGKA